MSAVSKQEKVSDFGSDLRKHTFWKESAEKVCEDEENICGKYVIVTGSNTGIGKMTAMQLAKRGAIVIMAVRNLQKGQEALDDIKKSIGEDAKLELMRIDMGDLQSIKDFVREYESKHPHLNILVNNAGMMNPNEVLLKTKDGFEEHIGVNHLGPLLLTRLLIHSLKKGAPSRIICVSSSQLALATLDLKDLMMEKKIKTGDNGKEQFNISKLAHSISMIKLVKALEEEKGDIKLFQLCPGFVKTDLFRHETGWVKGIMYKVSLAFIGQSPHSGCETVVYLSVSKGVAEADGSGKGEIYRFKKPWDLGNKLLKDYDMSEKSGRLLKMSEELICLKEKSESLN